MWSEIGGSGFGEYVHVYMPQYDNRKEGLYCQTTSEIFWRCQSDPELSELGLMEKVKAHMLDAGGDSTDSV